MYTIVNGSSGNDFLDFEGSLGQFTQLLVNPYSGFSIFVDEEKNINEGIYNAMGGNLDTISMTNVGDVLTLTDGAGTIFLIGVERLSAGNGGDIVIIADADVSYGDVIINGGQNQDILWGNAGNDTINGGGGADIIDGGPGNDKLYGGNDNFGDSDDDMISGGDGDDTIYGELGDDLLQGGSGNDQYHYEIGDGNDTIQETSGTDSILFSPGITLADISFSVSGTDLIIDTDGTGNNTITIEDHFAPDGSGRVENITFADLSTFDLTTLNFNEDPVAQDDMFNSNEDTVVTGNVLADNGNGADSDDDGDSLQVTPATLTTVNGGTVELLASGDFTYTPAENFFGTDSFDYTVEDGNGGSDNATVTLNVASVNDEPVAQDDSFNGTEDTNITGNVLVDNGSGVDSDVDGGTLSAQAETITTAMGGTVELLANGDFTYTPAANFNGADSFEYTLLDGQGGSDTATVNLNVSAVNDDPVAQDDSFGGNEDTAITGNLLADNGSGVDSDVDGDALQVTPAVLTTANGGTVEILANGDFSYTPAENFFGTDSFDYTVEDGNGGSDSATVTLNVTSVNDDPTAQDDSFNGTEGQDVGGNLLNDNGNGVDSDVEGNTLSVVSGTFATSMGGSVTIDANGLFTYTPGMGFFGVDSFDYTLLDGQGGSDVGTATLNIADNPNLFVGTNSGELISGTNDNDVIKGLAGDDDLRGNDGDDEIFGGDGDDTIYGGEGNDTVEAGDDNDLVFGDEGNDTLNGQDGNDTILGDEGDDVINGGSGNDILRGGSGQTTTITVDKDFADDIVFPGLQEGVNISNLKPPGDPALGINDGNLSVDFAATATITFRDGYAGYNNTLGVYSIASDGTIEMSTILWANVKTAGIDVAHQIDIPGGENGGDFGFFIVADGNTANGGYGGLDITGEGNVSFVYDYGGANERAANVNDDGGDISLVYDDGTTVSVLQGPVYHTTDRGDSTDINPDGKTHIVSGLLDVGESEVLRIGFEDLPCLGDADYEDVLFDLDINEETVIIEQDGNDTLIGGAGDDYLFGEGGDDLLVVGEGFDRITGGQGSDTIYFDVMDASADIIYGFERGVGGDVINITDILEGYDPLTDAISDFVQLTDSGANTKIEINADGDIGGEFTTLAVVNGGVGNDTLADLINNGNLVADQEITV